MIRAIANPPNPWANTSVDYDLGEVPEARVEVFEDHSRTILSKNDSPDLRFGYSANPYRGCLHACAYCYARPTHEYLGFGAGTDFDTKLVVKPEAPTLLREAFDKRSWKGDVVVFSGVTDCYQPLEASYRLTRGMIDVCTEYRNPVGIITKSPVIERDIDALVRLSEVASLHVSISIPIFNEQVARAIEPLVTTPLRRMRIIERLANAGLKVGINVAPIIPGLNESDLSPLLSHAKAAGAVSAGISMLRLPGAVREVFEARIRQALPLRAERILNRLREAHGGKVYRAEFGLRGRGTGQYADMVHALFEQTAARLGLATHGLFSISPTFERPLKGKRQLSLF